MENEPSRAGTSEALKVANATIGHPQVISLSRSRTASPSLGGNTQVTARASTGLGFDFSRDLQRQVCVNPRESEVVFS